MTLQKCVQKQLKNLRWTFFSLVKKLSKFPLITSNSLSGESRRLLLLRRLKQKIDVKPLKLLVQLMAHTISYNYWQKQRYFLSIQVIVGYNLQLIDKARGFPGSIHNSRVLRHTALCKWASNRSNVTGRCGRSAIKMDSKAIRI